MNRESLFSSWSQIVLPFHLPLLPGPANQLNRSLNLEHQPQFLHAFAHICTADGWCSRCNPHDTVGPIHSVTKHTKGYLGEEALDSIPNLVKHHRHCHKSLQWCYARLIQLHAKMLTPRHCKAVYSWSRMHSKFFSKVLLLACLHLN